MPNITLRGLTLSPEHQKRARADFPFAYLYRLANVMPTSLRLWRSGDDQGERASSTALPRQGPPVELRYAGLAQANCRRREVRSAAPKPKKPKIIIAHVAASGTPATLTVKLPVLSL